tara:strand:- start:38 stop:274 length:237 start_codon:yes stop_codon:yes gene_type:complete
MVNSIQFLTLILNNPTLILRRKLTMTTKIAMTDEQWNTVIDAVNDKYPDSDCLDILINNVRYFPTFLNNNSNNITGGN